MHDKAASIARAAAANDRAALTEGAAAPAANARIDLADQAPFTLGTLLVEPSIGRVRFADQELSLQPRILQVLVALSRRPGETVSRDELMASCWGLVVVGDDALTRCILRLRSLLDESGSDARIETIPRIGYRLDGLPQPVRRPGVTARVPAAAIVPDADLQAATGPEPKLARSRLSRLFVAAFAALFVLLIAAQLLLLLLQAPDEAMSPVLRRTLVVADPGPDMGPALSPDGGQLVYAALTGTSQRVHLFLRSSAGGERLQLTDSPSVDHSPVWSPDGSRIAFARGTWLDRCKLMVRTVPVGIEQEVGTCTGPGLTTLAWTPDGKSLVYSDRMVDGWSRHLVRTTLQTGQSEPVLLPPSHVIGDERPRFSPDGRYLAFARVHGRGHEAVMLLDLAGNKLTEIVTSLIEINGLAWSPDSRHLIFSGQDESGTRLERVNLRTGKRQAIQSGQRYTGSISAARFSGRLAIETMNVQSNLYAYRLDTVDGDKAGTPVVASSTRETHPTLSPRGDRLAFMSERTGHQEVWLADLPGGAYDSIESIRRDAGDLAAQPLTTDFGGAITALNWSPDGRKLVAVCNQGMTTRLSVIDVETRTITRLIDDVQQKLSPTWSDDSRSVTFATKSDNGWQLLRVALSAPGRTEPVGETGYTSLHRGASGTMIARKTDGSFWLLRAGDEMQAVPIADALPDGDPLLWAVADDQLLRVRWSRSGGMLVRTRMSTGQSEDLFELTALQAQGITLSSDGRVVIIPKLRQRDSDIELLELRPPD